MQHTHSQGFTFIEIMVVVVIIGILASFIAPVMIDRPDQARVVKAKQDLLTIESALDLYRLDNGAYPTNDQGLLALVSYPELDPKPHHWRQYLKHLPLDPWGRPYHYLIPGEHGEIDVFTYGANGEPTGDGIHATIGNWLEKHTPS